MLYKYHQWRGLWCAAHFLNASLKLSAKHHQLFTRATSSRVGCFEAQVVLTVILVLFSINTISIIHSLLVILVLLLLVILILLLLLKCS